MFRRDETNDSYDLTAFNTEDRFYIVRRMEWREQWPLAFSLGGPWGKDGRDELNDFQQ